LEPLTVVLEVIPSRNRHISMMRKMAACFYKGISFDRLVGRKRFLLD